MNMTQRFFSRVSALAAFALALTAFGPQAQALTTRMDTPIGEIRLAFDTVASVGISLRTKSRDYDWVSSQNGGNNADRNSVRAANRTPTITLPAGTPGGIGGFDIVSGTVPNLGGTTGPVIFRNRPIGFGTVANTGTLSTKGADQKNFAASANGDDGRLNFDKGDITALTFKVLSDIQADLSTKYGEFTAFMRIQAYADPVLRDGSFYERIGPDDAAKRELGRDIKILDGYLSWDWDISTGIPEIGDLPFNLRVGKLTTNNWGEATFSLSGISAGIVIDVPSARRAGSEIKEIIQPEYMVYGSIGLPFDISVDAYYQFHHTIWNLDVGGSPTATSDLGNPGNEIGGYLWLSSSPTSGTFRDNCVTATNEGSPFRQAAATLNTAQPTLNAALPLQAPDCFDYTIALDEESRRTGLASEQIRLNNDDYNSGTRVQFTEADDQGQWGVRLSYYIDTFYLIPPMSMMGMGDAMGGFMEDGFSLPGIEFNFSYQNVHSRVPYVRYGLGGRPVVTKAITGSSSTASAIALQALGCNGGAATAGLESFVAALNELDTGDGFGRGFYLSGRFRDTTIANTQNTIDHPDLTNSDIIRLGLDPKHFRGIAAQTGGDTPVHREGLRDFLQYARAADAILGEFYGDTDTVGTFVLPTALGDVARANGVTTAEVGGFAAIFGRNEAGDPTLTDAERELLTPANGAIVGQIMPAVAGLVGTAITGYNTTSAGANSIENSVLRNGANRYDVARIICAQALVQTGVSDLVTAGATGVLPAVGSEFLSVQYIPSTELYYPENIQVIGGSFNTTIPWMEWGIQGEISYRPNMPLQVDVTEQIISVIVAQGTGLANVGDASRFTLAAAVTTGADQNPALTQAERNSYYDEYTPLVVASFAPERVAAAEAAVEAAMAAGVAAAAAAEAAATATAAAAAAPDNMALADAADAATATSTAAARTSTAATTQATFLSGLTPNAGAASVIFGRPFRPEIYEDFVTNGRRGVVSEFEADMLNFTIGTTALYNNSNPVVNFLGADQAIFLMEFNAIQFLDALPQGWGQGRAPTTRADKGITLHCIARAGTELPLGGIVGLDDVDDRRCSPDDTSMGYTVFGFLDYNNVFGTAWRLRPSMALRHGVKGNTPSPVPGWREDTLSVTWGLEANFQNSWRASMSYVAFFDVGSNDYNSNSGNDSWSFNISYAF